MLKRATIACLLCLALLPAAAEAAPEKVRAGQPRLTELVGGRATILVPVRYPIELSGRQVGARLELRLGGERIRSFSLRARTASTFGATPKPRRTFTHVFSVRLGKRLTRALTRARKPLATVVAPAILDIAGDGVPDFGSRDTRGAALTRAGRYQCETPPGARIRSGQRVALRLPRCGSALRWRIARGPDRGNAWIRDGKLRYRSGKSFRGTTRVVLSGRRAGSSSKRRATRVVEIKVGAANEVVVRAMGDSVTAGFGFYDNGEEMTIGQLLSCKPAEDFYNDACSSNSVSRDSAGKKVEYAPDYGLANNISWAAQWANRYGIGNYKNYAVTGSEPINWLPGGQLYATAKKIWAEDPDYILMTMGANPLLSEMLFGVDEMGCAIWADVLGEYRKCVEEAFAGVKLDARLRQIYRELIARTDATIVLMQYHLSVPASALAYNSTQIAEMGALLNARIAKVAAEVEPKRLRVVAPPHFNVGVDISPVYPSRYSCSRFGFKVDGRSVQSIPAQDELLLTHPLSFCSGPASGPPWVISGDTGIHPSAAGYAQMSSRVPTPVR